MQKSIWVVGSDREQMMEVQRKINAEGGMRAVCMLSYEALEKMAMAQESGTASKINKPSLVILDYEMSEKEEYRSLKLLKKQPALAGVPLFFMIEERTPEIDEFCYEKGAMVVLHKPFSKAGILRIERAAWQYDTTINYEKKIQKQAAEVKMARQIVHLNEQLTARNELLRQIFGRYFSENIVSDILEHPQGAAIGGNKRDLTVLMADLRGFTAISESLLPEEVTQLLNEYFGKMWACIARYKGAVIEYLGDGILAVFGVTGEMANHTEAAIAAAVEMQNAMGEVQQYCQENGYPMLEMGIGIHCGETFIGNVGAEQMMRYNVIGSVVNTCSRIESCAVGGQIWISGEARMRCEAPLQVVRAEQIMVKGIEEPVQMAEISGIEGQCGVFRKADFEETFWKVKEECWLSLSRITPQKMREHPWQAKVLGITEKRLLLDVGTQEMALFQDVELICENIFSQVYAKIVDCQGSRIQVVCTRTNKEYEDWVGEVRRGCEK